MKADPVEFPHRYSDPRDIETVALLSASLAYGRADLFKPKIAGILSSLGPSPARAMASLTVSRAAELLDGFVYRFNLPADVGVLLLGIGALLQKHGSLESAFLAGRTASWQQTLAKFARSVREAAPEKQIIRAMGKTRGLAHLLPSAEAGAAKRLNLYLRWMVRKDAIDFGVWKRIAPSELMIPLDTHVMRISQWLGLTDRATLSWATAEDVTTSLRMLDADDPVRYDFALCHYGMSGACPAKPVKANCQKCPLRSRCSIGRRARGSG
ncbi:MAG: TIGR02757 family protein [Archangium sp.]|nr:TIGR02757 family protein [Archangium sp.]